MKPQNKTLRPPTTKFILGTTITALAALQALYFLILNVFYVHKESTFDLYTVGSIKSSGYHVFTLDASEFTIMHGLSICLILLATGLALGFMRHRKTTISVTLTGILVMGMSVYGAVLLGNILGQKFGALWAIIGIIIVIGAGFIISPTGLARLIMKST